MRRILILCSVVCLPFTVLAQYCGLESPILVRNGEIQEIPIDITSFVNNDLSDPSQGVAEVKLTFTHLNVITMSVALRSPAGDVVTLIGPQLPNFFPNFNTQGFDITFIPCGGTPAPDMFYGDAWDNTNDFSLINNFTGSYYPNSGCLEAFSNGPVNGQWTLIFQTDDGAFPNDILPTSNFSEVQIIFRDDEGNPCCDANAGTFNNPTVAACQNDPSLAFTPEPVYAVSAPDSSLFGFIYLISDSTGAIIDVSSEPDLTSFLPGAYQVCGLSYDFNDASNIPFPDGTVNINDLRSNLASTDRIFCGDISTNCVDVMVLPPSPVTVIDTTICDGQTVSICGNDFSVGGAYTIPCVNANGCDSIVNLNLNVTDVLFTPLAQTICRGDSVQISAGGPFYRTEGTVQETFVSVGGCDSIVELSLTINDPVNFNKEEIICFGENYIENGDTFNVAGTYEIIYPGAASTGCDSVVLLDLDVLNPVAAIAPPDLLDCNTSSVILDGTLSSPAGNLAFVWMDSTNQPIGNTAFQEITTPGKYFLTVNQISNGLLCSSEDSVIVNGDTLRPFVDIGTDQLIDCENTEALLGSLNSSDGPEFVYEWSSTNGNIIAGQNTLQVTADAAGLYQLLIRNTVNGCADSASVEVVADQDIPIIMIEPWINLSCTNDSTVVDATGSASGLDIVFSWSAEAGGKINGENTLMPTFFEPGRYQLLVRDTSNFCADSAFVEITADTVPPTVNIADVNQLLDCNNPDLQLDGSASDAGANFEPLWRALNGGRISGGQNTLTPTVDTAGTYRLVITNIISGCRDSASVEVSSNFVDVMPSLTKSSDLNCTENTVTIDAKGSFPQTGVSYSWSTSDGNIVGPLNQDIATVDAVGTYRVIVQDIASGCLDSTTIAVALDTVPPVTEAGNAISLTCTNPSAPLNSTGSSIGTEFQYAWTGPCIVSGADSPAPIVECAGFYTLTITNLSNGCSSTDSVEVLDNTTLPVANAGLDTTISCFSRSLILGDSATTTGVGINYQWSGPAFLSGATTRFPLIDQSGEYILTVTNTATGCVNMDTVIIQVDTLQPIADAGTDQLIDCQNVTAVLGGPGTSTGTDLSYAWSTDEGRFTGPVDMAVSSTDSAGLFQLVVENTRNGCVDSAQVTISFDQELPAIDIGDDPLLSCAHPTAVIGSDMAAQGPELIYTWSGPDDCIVSPADLPQVIVNCEGFYRLQVLNTDNNCQITDSILVVRDFTQPIAALADTAFIDCSNGEALLDGAASQNGILTWIFENDTIAVDVPSINVGDTGNYTLIVVDTIRGCVDSASIQVVQDCTVEAAIATPNLLTCDRQIVTLDASSSVTGTNQEAYSWTTDNPTCILTDANAPIIEIACSGTYTVTVTNLAVGVVDSQSIFVGIDTIAPRVEAGLPDTLTCDQPTVQIDASASAFGVETLSSWSTLEGDTISRDVITTVDSAGIYIFELINQNNGCAATDFVEIARNFNAPDLKFDDSVIQCDADSIIVGVRTSFDGNFNFNWSGPAIAEIIPGDTAIEASMPGIYRLEVTNLNNGCTRLDSVEIVSDLCPPCVDVATPDMLNCIREQVTIASSLCEPCDGCTYQWNTTNGTIIGSNTNPELNVGAAGIYTLTVTDTTTLSTTINVEVFEDTTLPVIDAGPDIDLNCQQSSLSLSVTTDIEENARFQWSEQSTPTKLLSEDATLTVSLPGTYSVTVQNNQNGCTTTETVVVGIDTIPPVANAGTDLQLNCTNNFVRLAGENSSSGPEFAYQWATTDGNIRSGSTATNPAVNRAGEYILTVTNTVNGCTASDVIRVTENRQLPEITPISDAEINCNNPVVVLRGNLPDPADFSARWYQLGINGDTLFSRNTDTIPANIAGTFIYELTNQMTGCINSQRVVVSENREAPIIDPGPDQRLTCTSTELQLRGSILTEGNSFEEQWLNANGMTLTDPSGNSPNIMQPGTYIYRVTNTENGCITEDSIEVMLDDIPPVLVLEQDETQVLDCSRPSLNLSSSVTTTGGNFQARWTTIDGRISGTANRSSITVTRGGTYVLRVTDQSNGCISSDSLQITDNFTLPDLVVDTLNGTELNCLTDSVSFAVSSTVSPVELFYRSPNGNTIDDFFDATEFHVTSPGRYFAVAVNPENACRDSVPILVSGNFDLPDIRISQPQSLTCERAAVTVSAAGSETGPAFTYEWMSQNSFVPSADPLQITVDQAGAYQLQVTNADNGCIDSLSVQVVADTMPPNVVIAEPEILDCENSLIELDASSSTPFGNLIYDWQVIDGGQFVDGNDSLVRVQVDGAGSYAVSVTNSVNGCTATNTVSVDANTAPIDEIFFTVIPPDCQGDGTGSIRVDSVAGGVGPYAFAVNSDIFVMQNIFQNLEVDTHLVKVMDARGCTLERSTAIPGTPELFVELGPDLNIDLGDSIRVEALVNRPYESLSWMPLPDSLNPSSAVQILKPVETTTYRVFVSDSLSCTAQGTIVITVNTPQSYFIPTAFSPNGDGNNDIFYIFADDAVQEVKIFQIFDRWGTMVFQRDNFQPNNPNLGWDGTFQGRKLRSAVFVFYAELEYIDGRTEIIKGDFVLVER